jgi:hypothetical protein
VRSGARRREKFLWTSASLATERTNKQTNKRNGLDHHNVTVEYQSTNLTVSQSRLFSHNTVGFCCWHGKALQHHQATHCQLHWVFRGCVGDSLLGLLGAFVRPLSCRIESTHIHIQKYMNTRHSRYSCRSIFQVLRLPSQPRRPACNYEDSHVQFLIDCTICSSSVPTEI